jgi:hypothetical protein
MTALNATAILESHAVCDGPTRQALGSAICPRQHLLARRLPCEAAPPTIHDSLATFVGWLGAAVVTIVVAAAVLALLVAEYAALWAMLVAPWLSTAGAAARW